MKKPSKKSHKTRPNNSLRRQRLLTNTWTDGCLSLAASTALASTRKGWGGPFGAVITQGGRIVAKAANTVLKTHNPTCHAEMNAIRMASQTLKRHVLDDCEIYSTTEPCPMCFSAIHWARIKKIVFSTTISQVKSLGFNELSVSNATLKKLGRSRVQIHRVHHPACEQLLARWATLPTKKTY